MEKKIKAIVLTVLIVIAALLLAYFVGTGFMKNTSVYFCDFSVSEDGGELTVTAASASSVGYIRDISIASQEDGKLYLDCYSAFGGINGRIGAKDSFTLPLDEDTSIIAVYRNSDCYEEVLLKDADGKWRRAD